MASVTLSLRSAQKKCQRYKIVCPQFVYFIKPFTMFLIAVVSAILAVTNADPLGCCTPSRYSGLLQEIGGALKENSTTAIAIDVGIFEITINHLSCKNILLIKCY